MVDEVFLAVIGMIIALIAHAATLFYWGGKLQTTVKYLREIVADHEARLRKVEDSKP